MTRYETFVADVGWQHRKAPVTVTATYLVRSRVRPLLGGIAVLYASAPARPQSKGPTRRRGQQRPRSLGQPRSAKLILLVLTDLSVLPLDGTSHGWKLIFRSMACFRDLLHGFE